MKLMMIIHRSGFVVEVMATSGGWAMVRRKGAMPTIISVVDLRHPFPNEISEGTIKVLGNLKRTEKDQRRFKQIETEEAQSI
jgi:hypothetical protein